jgi:hypothetical protein
MDSSKDNAIIVAAGTAIDLPLRERNNPWLFDNIDLSDALLRLGRATVLVIGDSD